MEKHLGYEVIIFNRCTSNASHFQSTMTDTIIMAPTVQAGVYFCFSLTMPTKNNFRQSNFIYCPRWQHHSPYIQNHMHIISTIMTAAVIMVTTLHVDVHLYFP